MDAEKNDPGKIISNELGDFTTTPRLLKISALALAIGAISAFVALGLLKLIAFFTNIFFFQRFSADGAQPLGHHLSLFVIVVPVIGGLIIGFIARYGSDRIRGAADQHGRNTWRDDAGAVHRNNFFARADA